MAITDLLTPCEREIYEAAAAASREGRATLGALLTLRSVQSIAYQRAHYDGDRTCHSCNDPACSWAPEPGPELQPGCNVVGRTGRTPDGGTYPKIEAVAPALLGGGVS